MWRLSLCMFRNVLSSWFVCRLGLLLSGENVENKEEICVRIVWEYFYYAFVWYEVVLLLSVVTRVTSVICS